MNRDLAIRALALYAPVAAFAMLWIWRRPFDGRSRDDARRFCAALLLAVAWNAAALFAVNAVAPAAGWWTFGANRGVLAGMPVDLYLGWIVWWGAVPLLAGPALPLPAVVAVMGALDLWLMPLSAPVVRLEGRWYLGEAVALAAALVPSQLLARWTLNGTRLHWRAALQAVAFSVLMLFVLPTAVLEQTGRTWEAVFDRTPGVQSLMLQLIAIPGVLALSAVQEFVRRGRGTPLPYDPPGTLVTSGPYAYVANPMQLGMAVAFAGWAVMIGSVWMLAACAMAVAYGAGLAAWHEHADLGVRFGEPWRAYRRQVATWRPRWRPFTASTDRLYVAETCGLCRGVGAWLASRGVAGVDLLAAEDHPTRRLTRMTYEPADGGPADEGIAAFARAIERIHFGWAWVGMLIRLPVVRPFLQLVVDASGGYARPVAHVTRQNAASRGAREDSKSTPRFPTRSTARCRLQRRRA